MRGQRHVPAAHFPTGKTRYRLYRRLGGSQGRSGQVQKFSPLPGFDPRTVQPVGSRYNDYATRPTISLNKNVNFSVKCTKILVFQITYVLNCNCNSINIILETLNAKKCNSKFWVVGKKKKSLLTLKTLRVFYVHNCRSVLLSNENIISHSWNIYIVIHINFEYNIRFM